MDIQFNLSFHNKYTKSITDRAPQQSTFVEFDLIKTFSSICVTCTFLEGNSATDSVAVVHQQISQLNSSGLINIESSHKFTRSGDTAYGCIEGVNLEQYQVGVIGGRRSIAMTHHTRMCQYSLICILNLNSSIFLAASSPRSLYRIIGIVCAGEVMHVSYK